MSHNDEQQFLERVRSRLDESVAEMDPLSLQRLRSMRREALQAGAAAPRWSGAWFVPAGAMGAVLLLSLVFALWQPVADIPLSAADMELLAAGDNLELYENIEFYQWLPAVEPASDLPADA